MIVSVEVVAVMRETERNDPFMKKMNKLLALMLAAAMSIGMLSGCASKEEPAAPETPAAPAAPGLTKNSDGTFTMQMTEVK